MSEQSYKFKGVGLGAKEKHIAEKRFNDYLRIYPHLNKLSLKTLLEELIFLETISDKYKEKINQVTKAKTVKSSTAVPSALMRELQENTKQILDLKDKLGLFDNKEKLDAYKDIENLQKKYAEYRKNNSLRVKVTCPHCSRIFFLKRRTENYEPFISPFFDKGDNILFNRPLMELWHDKVITTEQAAKVLGVSPDQILWLEEKYYKKKTKE